jgi:CDP-diacylglycerol---glycerol-3-phosphate 3-phosphatidyltransferase
MYRQLPNTLTVLRVVLAAAFFVVLNAFRYPDGHPAALWGAIALFVLAAITDALDGYLARKWHVESTFGRIMDPFCDKVLILGAFIYLAGPRFTIPEAVARGEFFDMSSGVYPWMVAVMLARELLVTALREEVETTGTKFPAKTFGKAKMILQSIGVPIILCIVYFLPRHPESTCSATYEALAYTRDILVYAMVIVTFLSGLPYVTGAARVFRQGREPKS